MFDGLWIFRVAKGCNAMFVDLFESEYDGLVKFLHFPRVSPLLISDFSKTSASRKRNAAILPTTYGLLSRDFSKLKRARHEASVDAIARFHFFFYCSISGSRAKAETVFFYFLETDEFLFMFILTRRISAINYSDSRSLLWDYPSFLFVLKRKEKQIGLERSVHYWKVYSNRLAKHKKVHFHFV